MSRFHLRARATRLALPALAVLVLASVTLPNLLRAQDARLEADHQTRLIERHMRILSAPPEPNRYAGFERFISVDQNNQDSLADTVQADLSRRLQAPDSRLIDLKRIDDRTDIADLTGLRFQADIEGDLQAVLSGVAALEQLNHPILIERIELIARGSTDRPDQRIRLALTFIRWVETPS